MFCADTKEGAMGDTSERNNRQDILQFMTTEHFVLQTARAATIQEANQRANLFLTSVSSATIALAFVAQVTQMGSAFVLFSVILLPCLYIIGLVTFVRAVQVAIEDMVHARGMARIRHYYVELAPAMERYFVHATHDNYRALLADKAFKRSRWQSFMSTSTMVNAVASAIAGVFAGIVASAATGTTTAIAAGCGILVFAASAFLLWRFHERSWRAGEESLRVVFPDS
jgi:hypothetical protein